MRDVIRHQGILFVSMALFAFVVLFFISPDSPTHYFYDRCDSANFFMCGKAWMNGMIPYVDFTDSKGPLLWLLYGIGYLLSPRSYSGVLIVSVISYAFTYYYTYKTAAVFLSEKYVILLSTILMTFAYFCPLYHFETRAEDFCLPFVMASLYYTCRLLYSRNETGNSTMRRTSFVLGLSISATILIKYSIAGMLCIFIPIIWIVFHAKQQNLWKSLFWIIVGGLCIALPFVVVFLYLGNLTDFINQYFFVTFQTIKESQNANEGGLHYLILTMMQNAPILLMVIVSVVSPFLIPYMERYRFFPLITASFAILLCLPNAKWPYYFSILSPYMIFAVIAMARLLESHKALPYKRLFIAVTIMTVSGTVLCNYHYYYYSKNAVGMLNLKLQKNNPERQAYQYFSDVLCSFPGQPRIIYADTQCISEFGVASEALPGCRDWSQQNGATPQMRQATWEAISQGRTDFVVATTPESIVRLLSLGYTQIPNKHVTSNFHLFQRVNPCAQ